MKNDMASRRLVIGGEAEEIDLRLDVADPERKRAAIAAHRSQLVEGDPASLFPPGIVDALLREEWYRVVLGSPLVDNDPFAGLL